ncbi:outer membrane lipoprotein-sorting protein [Halobacteriovorax sp. GB3]|uniref:outer membrane lipoprotein-sorting protein n=1 Tax=Halobacteriovorax sp. GB3 TaxID=2719615 RepID=UPI00235F991E|nr:outer membrane lipoprotein-sorting protein [Halobacteriovorax sp. GB3]MDD0852010.1 outer membrane lipoprotein-sorting protein [Halobacteriovorax sp. GB3]
MKTLVKIFILSGLFLNAHAKESDQKGLEIAKEMQRRSEGFLGETSKMKMTLITAYGEKIERLVSGKVLEIKGDGDWSLSEFLTPKDVSGTKMLTKAYKEKSDMQWLYLPSIRRVKRISSSSRFSSFMGSEFSYEDLGSQEIEKYNFKLVKEDKLDKEDVWVLSRVSKEKSGYSKQILYVTKNDYKTLKVEYFDRRGELLKVSTQDQFKTYKVGERSFIKANRIWMKNVQTKKESIFEWVERKIGVTLKESDFSKRALK